MIEYLGREIPEDEQGLLDLIRADAHRHLQWDPRDARPPRTLDWVSGLATAHPELLATIEAAYAQLLADADPDEVREVLAQAVEHPGSDSFERLLVDAIEHHADALRAKEDTTHSDRSLLGAVVRTLSSLKSPPPVTPGASRVLGAIDAPADGWPNSLLLALVADFDAHSEKLIPALERLASDDEESDLFVSGMIASGPPLTTRGFEAIGKAPVDLRDRFAASVRALLTRSEEGRKLMISSGAINKLPADAQARLLAPRSDPWPDYATRLGVRP